MTKIKQLLIAVSNWILILSMPLWLSFAVCVIMVVETVKDIKNGNTLELGRFLCGQRCMLKEIFRAMT